MIAKAKEIIIQARARCWSSILEKRICVRLNDFIATILQKQYKKVVERVINSLDLMRNMVLMTLEPTLGDIIDRTMNEKGLTGKAIGSRFYKALGFSTAKSSYGYISMVRTGHLFGSSSFRAVKNEKYLRRLSKLLYFIGFQETNPLIVQLKAKDGRFEYPPENRENLDKLIDKYKAKT